MLEWAKEDSNSDELLNQEVKQVGAKMARYFGSTQSKWQTDERNMIANSKISDTNE